MMEPNALKKVTVGPPIIPLTADEVPPASNSNVAQIVIFEKPRADANQAGVCAIETWTGTLADLGRRLIQENKIDPTLI